MVTGKAALESFWQSILDMGISGIELRTGELEDLGDTAIEVGAYTLRGADGQSLDQGKYIVIWKREGGEWLLHRDIFNSSLPAPA